MFLSKGFVLWACLISRGAVKEVSGFRVLVDFTISFCIRSYIGYGEFAVAKTYL